MVMSCLISLILLIIILIHTIYQFYFNKENHGIDYRVKLLTILIIFGNMIYNALYCFMKSSLIVSLIIGDDKERLSLIFNDISCNICTILGEICWILSKIFMIILFTYKLEITFGESSIGLSKYKLITFRIIVFVTILLLYIWWLFQIKDHIETVHFADNNGNNIGYYLCTQIIMKLSIYYHHIYF